MVTQPKPSPYEPAPPSVLNASLQQYLHRELMKLSQVLAIQARQIEDHEARIAALEP